MCSIDNLPEEMIRLILKKLPSHDVKEFGRTNKRFKQLANGVLNGRGKSTPSKIVYQ